MIYSSLSSVEQEAAYYPKAIRVALQFLTDTDFDALQDGRYEIQGDQSFVILGEMETKPLEAAKPEAHNRYLDIQCLLQGKETIGFAQGREGIKPVEDLLAEKDVCFYSTKFEEESFLAMSAGEFAVFFPGDIHRPLVERDGVKMVRKAIFKINVDLLEK